MFKLGVSKVDDALNWVWLVDFGQGNLATAQMEAEASILSHWNTSTLFARGVVHQLQGEYKHALSLFEEAFISANSAEKRYIFAAAAYFAELQAREILPDGCLVIVEGNYTESLWKKRFNQLKSHLESEKASQAAKKHSPSSESSSVLEEDERVKVATTTLSSLCLEGDFINFVAEAIPTWRTILGRWGEQAQKEIYLAEIEQKFTQNLESYQSLDIFTIAKNLYSVLAELLALTGKAQDGWDILDNLVKAHKKHGKFLETAWYLLCQGDLLMSPASFGKPVVFGYHLNISGESLLERTRDYSNLNSTSAQQLYLEARQYFAAADAPRGEGITILRLAYLNAIDEQWNLANYGYEEAIACFEAVGDRLNAMAAEMGKFWSCLHYQDLDEKIIDRATQLALTSRENGAIAQGVGWALTFALAAQEDLKKNEEVAISLARLAETILAVFTEDRDLLPWQLFQQILLNYDSVMQDIYANLAEISSQQDNNCSKTFIFAEMANNYSLRKSLAAVCQQNLKTLEIDQISSYLPQDTLVISYLLTKTQLLAWAVNSEGTIKYSQVKELNERPFSFQTLLETTQDWLNRLVKKESTKTISRILESVFLASFDREIAQARHILIVPCTRLSSFPFTTLLWRTQPLSKQKSLSYLSTVSQLTSFNSFQSTTQEALFVVYPETIWQQKIHINSFSPLQSPSILEGVAVMIADLYDTQPLLGNQVTKDNVLANINRQPKIVHFFIQETTFSNLDLSQLELKGNIVILTLANLKIGRLASSKLIGIAQSLIYTGAKTVLINRYPLTKFKDVAASMLLLYFHLGLCAGHSVAESFCQAQQQLESITVSEAINFCNTVQSCIPWQKDSDRANRALLTKYMGDIFFLGKDYVRAAEAYEVAKQIFYNAGYPLQAKAFEHKYQQTIKLANTKSDYMPQQLIFNSLALRGMYQIIGDWQQAYRG
ncbi:MAG: CHAT domain-containing protein [Xenococcaceae cyanobacterium MO_188.B29]|nr:CHAT domain-containing protein [Xenococcaceae cyanobacterium MO_188.B29]